MKLSITSRIIRYLARQKTGIVSGFVTAFLLAISSLFVPDPRGTNPLPFSEDLSPFFSSPQLHFWWFYLLLAATTFYACSTVSAVWLSLSSKQWNKKNIAVLLAHVGFLTGLVAHLVAGIGNESGKHIVLAPYTQTIEGHQLRVNDVALSYNRDGSLRSMTADIEFDGSIRRLGFNEPIFFDLNSFLLIQGQGKGFAVQITDNSGSFWLTSSADVKHGYQLQRVSNHPSLRQPMAQILYEPNQSTGWYANGMSLPGGARMLALTPYKGIQAQLRHNNGILPMLAASLCFLLALGLLLPGYVRDRDH